MAAEKHDCETMKPSCSDLRCNSTGNIQNPKYVPSRYLKNPVSSCHDHCKIRPPFKTISEKCSSFSFKPPFSPSAHPRTNSRTNSSRQVSIYKKKSKLDGEKLLLPSATSVSDPKSAPDSEKCKRVKTKFDLSEKNVKKPIKEVKKGGTLCTSSLGSSSKPSRSSSFKDGSLKSSSKGNFNGLLVSQGKLMNKPRNRDEEKSCSPRKLQFRRGKVFEAKPECSNVRRLQFRKVRLADDIQRVGDTRRRLIRRTEVNAVEVKNPKSEKILLRHRSMEKRKKNQSLFNNVIEETASKLVVSRKSKVKALVGAFETVISLQDLKPRKV